MEFARHIGLLTLRLELDLQWHCRFLDLAFRYIVNVYIDAQLSDELHRIELKMIKGYINLLDPDDHSSFVVQLIIKTRCHLTERIVLQLISIMT